LERAVQEELERKRSNGELAKTIPAGCRGAKLNLDALFATKRCDTKDTALPPPAANALTIAVELGSKTVRPGGTTSITLRMTNQTKEPLVVDLEQCSDFEVRAFDAKGDRADEPSTCFEAGTVCLMRVVRVLLDPSGSITKQFSFRARTKDPGELCRIQPPGPMDPATYKLEVDLPFFDRLDPKRPNAHQVRTARAELVVK
jgi:hypothetical protein